MLKRIIAWTSDYGLDAYLCGDTFKCAIPQLTAVASLRWIHRKR